ncbi:MAG: gamma-glutamyltransferase [Acidobacteria bacterium]|nr:MAG: gamma-glutamyltransferase [Acidobacteriota bacterium]PYR49189.1 MAG: gamma-glutamyltransferase [Acidobacteriota bacterium]
MRMRRFVFGGILVLGVCGTVYLSAQDPSDEVRISTMRPVVRGRTQAAASMKAEATRAADRILQAGGNAFDAAVAGQAVLGLVDAASNGVGSDAVILVYDAKAKAVVSINAEGTAPRLATIEWYQKNLGGKLPQSDTLLSGTVPGVVDAWYTLLDRWGTMTFAQVLQPAIDTAENGFPIGERMAAAIAGSRKLKKYPTSVKVYFPGGAAPRPGDIFRNPDLARTLRKLVDAEKENAGRGRHEALKAARDRFYKGDIARTMAKFSEEQGGLFRYEDFASYTDKVETPVSIDYRGYRVYKNASANQGPTELFALNILEGYDLKKLGHNSPDYIHTSIEAVKLALGDREKYLGDMDFIQIPYEGLLSKEYARERRTLIDPEHASLELRPGVPEKFTKTTQALNRPVHINLEGEADHEGDTSYLAVIDRDRNMVSFEPSLHSGFGTGVVMADLGFIFNCRGDYYSLVAGEANALAPGKRPRSTLQSTLVMKSNQPFMIVGSPGGDDQVFRTIQTLLNIVDFGMNVQEAIEAPRWATRSFPASPFPHTMYPGEMSVEQRVPEAVREALIKRGHKLRVGGPWTMGSLAAIVVDQKTGVLSAGTDPRVDAYAIAW